MKISKRLLALTLALAMVLAGALSVTAAEAPKQDKLIVLHTNDTHGRDVAGSGIIGMGTVSALKQSYEDKGYDVLLLDAGDTLHGTPFATVDKGESVVELMNLAGYDAMTPGNHDFNYGYDHLKTLQSQMKFPLLSANVVLREGGDTAFPAAAIYERGGKKIGVFGLSTPETAYKTNPLNVQKILFADPYQQARLAVWELKAQGADYIIGLCHIGLDEGSNITTDKLAERVTGIDLIVDGHSHTTIEKGMKVGDTLIVSTGEYLGKVGMVEIDLETKAASASLIAAGSDALKELNDPAVEKKIAEIETAQKRILSEVVGRTTVDLEGAREKVRASETNLGNLVADAVRDAANAEIGFTNGGGLRASIKKGDVTKGDIITVLPFGNYIVSKRITGSAMVRALEHGVSVAPETNGGFLQVSGLTFKYDQTRPAGSRVYDVMVGGQPINPARYYLVATNDFMAVGGDGYTMLGEFPTENEFAALDEALISYMSKLTQSGTPYPGVEGRIVQQPVQQAQAAA